MNKKNKKLLWLSCMGIVAIFAPCYYVQADEVSTQEQSVHMEAKTLLTAPSYESYNLFSEKTEVDLTKVWTVKFGKTVDSNTLSPQNIGVVDITTNTDVAVVVNPGLDGVTATVSLQQGAQYISGHAYYLYASSGVKTADGKTLKPVKMKFTVKKAVADNTMYELIKNAMLSGVISVNVGSCVDFDYNNMVSTINIVVKENPLVLYYEGVNCWENGRLEFIYSRDQATTLNHVQMIKNKTKEIIGTVIKTGMDEYDKEKAIHDYIINMAKYDVQGYKTGTITPEDYSAYGVLVNGIGVCESYAEAMQYIMQQLGIDCRIVIGNSETHEWNVIKINGNWYQLDLTWDDPVMLDGSNTLRYNYFNVTDKQMKEDHTYTTEYPSCTAINDSYLYRK